MTDRNDTIERLRDIRDRAVASDGMFTERAAYMVKLIDDVLGLLKEQEPRVLTLEEVKGLQSLQDGAVWLEEWRSIVVPALPAVTEMSLQDFTFFVAIPFRAYKRWLSNEYYGKTWRCWSSRPTDEQREGTPWTE